MESAAPMDMEEQEVSEEASVADADSSEEDDMEAAAPSNSDFAFYYAAAISHGASLRASSHSTASQMDRPLESNAFLRKSPRREIMFGISMISHVANVALSGTHAPARSQRRRGLRGRAAAPAPGAASPSPPGPRAPPGPPRGPPPRNSNGHTGRRGSVYCMMRNI